MLICISFTHQGSLRSIFKKDKPDLFNLVMWASLTWHHFGYFIVFLFSFLWFSTGGSHAYHQSLMLSVELSTNSSPTHNWDEFSSPGSVWHYSPDANVYINLAAVKRWGWKRKLEKLQKWAISQEAKGLQKYTLNCLLRKNKMDQYV